MCIFHEWIYKLERHAQDVLERRCKKCKIVQRRKFEFSKWRRVK